MVRCAELKKKLEFLQVKNFGENRISAKDFCHSNINFPFTTLFAVKYSTLPG
jgi:hypothetical protein